MIRGFSWRKPIIAFVIMSIFGSAKGDGEDAASLDGWSIESDDEWGVELPQTERARPCSAFATFECADRHGLRALPNPAVVASQPPEDRSRSPRRTTWGSTLSMCAIPPQMVSDSESDPESDLRVYRVPLSVSKIDRLLGKPAIYDDPSLRGIEHYVVPLFNSLEHVRLSLPEPCRPMHIVLFGGGAALDLWAYKAEFALIMHMCI
jgi:hypothetical protein